MNRTTTNPRKRALWTLVVPILALMFSGGFQSLQAQVTPTPEGTVIPNVAEVTYTDANGNSYTPVSASVSVTVGFQGSLAVVGDADVAPAADTDDNEFDFTITNSGNGDENIEVTSVTTGAGSTVVENISYKIGATAYADLTALNAALALIDIAPGDDVVITIVYDAVAGSGGLDDDVTLVATSLRDAGTDSDSVNVAPPLGGAITVQKPLDQNRVPNPTGTPVYSMTFPVTSTLSGTDNVDLAVTLDGTNAAGITIVSIDGTAGSTKTLSFNYNQTSNIVVVFTVADNADGDATDITLTATAQTAPNPSDNETASVTIIKPNLTITKGVFTDAATSVPVGASEVFPGQTLYYRITVTNNGSAPATSVSVEDDLDDQLAFVAVTQTGTFWTLSESLSVVTATKATFPTSTTASFVIQVTVR